MKLIKQIYIRLNSLFSPKPKYYQQGILGEEYSFLLITSNKYNIRAKVSAGGMVLVGATRGAVSEVIFNAQPHVVGNNFVGFYENGVLISSTRRYQFTALEDRDFEVIFEDLRSEEDK